MNIKPMVVEEPFKQWVLDFIGVMNPNSSTGHNFILTTIDYFTIWAKAMPCKNVDQEAMIEMIKKIITCFIIP